jgi:acetoacetyl-[acyl-carrier protein] synthase
MDVEMSKLPVIVGIGGINAAGRSSGFHSYKRMISDVLSSEEMINTWCDLSNRMGINMGSEISLENIQAIKEGTFIRRIDSFNPSSVIYHHKAKLDSSFAQKASFIMKKSKLPKPIPQGWDIEELEDNEIKISVAKHIDMLISDTTCLQVSSGGNIPAGFDPGRMYNSHHHPRGLKLAVYGASDVLNSMGMEWEEILNHIKPDEVAVYVGSALSQIDENSLAGLISQPLLGNRINSKMIVLSLAEMPADFVNSYIINSVGATGTNMGACASFLYNLRQGIADIQAKKAKVVIVGNAEAPVVPEIIEGFRAMGALATDEQICLLDNNVIVDNRRACRPFSTNVGFTIAESSQFVVLMDDELALKLGANIYGSVADVFISADANKKSIAEPGIGNYITVAKATALAKAILGQEGLQETFVQAHGTGTPKNRTSESHILNEVAKAFSVKNWPISAIKSYIGHSLSAAAGDQLIASLGTWKYGWIPGIKTIDHIADDVHQSNLNILMDHYFVGKEGLEMKAVIINAKGFGGNNATALVLSPQKTLSMLRHKYGLETINAYKQKNVQVSFKSNLIDLETCRGNEKIIYKFGEKVMDHTAVSISPEKITLSEFSQEIDLPTVNPYEEYNI